jgi:hypothetical protein
MSILLTLALAAIIVISFIAAALIAKFKDIQTGSQLPQPKETKESTEPLVVIITVALAAVFVFFGLISWSFITQQRWLPLIGARCENKISVEKNKIWGVVSPCSLGLHIPQSQARYSSALKIESGDTLIVKAKGKVEATPNLSLTGYRNHCFPEVDEGYVNGPFGPEGSAISAKQADNCLSDNRLFPAPYEPYMALLYRDGERSEWRKVVFYKQEGGWLIGTIKKTTSGTLSFALNMGAFQAFGGDCPGQNTPYRLNEWGCFRPRYLQEYVGGIEIVITK